MLTRLKVSGNRGKNPNSWKHLRAILLHCFNVQINSREFSKAATNWKERRRLGGGGHRAFTLTWCTTCPVTDVITAAGDRKKKSLILSSERGKPSCMWSNCYIMFIYSAAGSGLSSSVLLPSEELLQFSLKPLYDIWEAAMSICKIRLGRKTTTLSVLIFLFVFCFLHKLAKGSPQVSFSSCQV